MGSLVICPGCQRHVSCGTSACPFCQVAISCELEPAAPVRRRGRAMPRLVRAVATSAVVLQGACGDSPIPIYGIAIDASRRDVQPNVLPDATEDAGDDGGIVDVPIGVDVYGLPADAGFAEDATMNDAGESD